MTRLCAFVMACLVPLARAEDPSTINLRRTVTVEVVKKTKDAVVNISATKLMNRRAFGGDPFWDPFGGGLVRVPANSLGSGFIVHRDGYVVTNHHVIDRARQIQVELADGRKLPAELISSDPEADLAILKISDTKPFPTLEMGDSSDLMIGEPVIAVGNPLGFSHSVSTGIVSAIHRDLKDAQDHITLGDVIQTDAAINPGNSGGPLLNAYGQVIAINTAIRGDAQNIGFAIQVNKLRDLIPELMNPLHASKLEIALKLTEQRKLTPPAGIHCDVLLNGDPKSAVTAINGQSISSLIDAYAVLLTVKDEKTPVKLKLANGEERSVAVKVAPQPAAIVEARKRFGMTIEAVSPALAEKFKLAVEDGLLITDVSRGSIAAKAGLQAGDVLTQIGRYRITSLEDFGILLGKMPASGKVRVGVVRGDQTGVAMLDLVDAQAQ